MEEIQTGITTRVGQEVCIYQTFKWSNSAIPMNSISHVSCLPKVQMSNSSI